jgi:hypothetical protein
VARKPNYDFERRKKEQDRKNKKEAKREERARRKAAGLGEEIEGMVQDENGDWVMAEVSEDDADESGDASADDETTPSA